MNTNESFNTEGAQKPTADEIAAMAYQLHVENGRQPDREWDDWFRAEQLLIISQKEAALKKTSSSKNVSRPEPNRKRQ